MRFSFRSTVRRLAAAAALPALALGLSLGHAPQAAAEGELGSGYFNLDIVVHKNDTADLTYTAKFGGLDTSDYCDKEILKGPDTPKDTTVEVVGDACELKAKAVPLEDLSKGETTLKHEGKKYIFRATSNTPPAGSSSDNSSFKVTISVTFPGKVKKTEGNAVVKGNKVTWTNPEGNVLSAEASDGSFNGLLWVLIGLVVVAVVTAAVIALVVVSKRKKTPPAGPFPQPGTQFPAQPGYGAGQPLTGTPYGQPQAYQQPGMAQQPPVAGQPYQQPSQPYQHPGGTPQPPVAGQPYQQPGYGQPQGGQAPGSNGYGY